jgi:hypothetical protein
MNEAPRPQRRTLYLLMAIFFVPLAAAFAIYYGSDWRPVGQTNHGELFMPPRPLPEAAAPLRDKWTLMYVGDGACDDNCRQALVFARQTRLSLNNEMTRVNRAFLALANCCDLAYVDREHAGLKVFDVSESGAQQDLLRQLPEKDREHSLFVVDPLGNLVMRYDVRDSPRGLLEDLKKLLRLSHIG